MSSSQNHNKDNIKACFRIKYHLSNVSIAMFWYTNIQFFTMPVYNLQGFEVKTLSTNLRIPDNNCRFYNKYRVKSTIYNRLAPPPPPPIEFVAKSSGFESESFSFLILTKAFLTHS